MAPVALLEILVVVVVYFSLPFSPSGVPWSSDFDWSLFNYTPVVTGGLAVVIGLWWVLGARRWFTGPRQTIQEDEQPI